MKKLFKLLPLIGLMTIAAAHAQTRYDGKVVAISTYVSGTTAVQVYATYVMGNRPACAGGAPTPVAPTYVWMTIPDENSPGGKRMADLVQSAYLDKRTVILNGAGTCSKISIYEDVNIITAY